MSQEFKPRIYQEKIVETCIKKNTLVVLPTGLGKTAIAALTAKNRLENYKDSKIVIVSPTKPLAQQHEETFLKIFPDNKITLLTGTVTPKKREEAWKNNQIIISTPQGLENDVIKRKINFEDTSLLVVDEAHRATGNYSYVYLAKKYVEQSNYQRIVALTASPGTDKETVEEVTNNLYIEQIEYRTKEHEEVLPYVKDLNIKYVELELPERMRKVKKFLENCYNSKLKAAKELGYLTGQISQYNKTQLLKLLSGLHTNLRNNKEYEILRTISLISEALKVQHALELIETQGVHSCLEYLKQLKKDAEKTKVKAVKNLVKDINFRSAYILAENLYREKITHPKLDKVEELIQLQIHKKKNSKIIIFSQYRDTGSEIKEKLNQSKVNAEVFVGQAKKKNSGMSQKQQKEMISRFANNEFNCLIATSVGEEGLDIPEVDLVLFYEPIPSAIRTVQRRGRTGRQKEGNVIMLITKQTRDEAFRWTAHHKEKKMYRELEKISKTLRPSYEKTKTLNDYQEIVIKTDYREKGSKLMKELLDEGINLDLEQLPIGDYQLSDEVIVEFKTVTDFVDSILDNRLLSQARDLKRYKKPFIIIQGEEDLYSQRRIHPNAIRGMKAALTINYGIPIIRTKNYKDTADYLKVIATREQKDETKIFQSHNQKPLSDKEIQEYIISSLPGIGNTLAKPLLKEFKTIKNIINASEEELQKVELIGSKKAKRLKELFQKEYLESTQE